MDNANETGEPSGASGGSLAKHDGSPEPTAHLPDTVHAGCRSRESDAGTGDTIGEEKAMTEPNETDEPSGASGGYAVGDCLAFCCGLGLSNRWEIHKVTKITPSGRLTCGPYALNPDLSVRGVSGYSGPHRAEPVTKEIVLEVRRRRALEYLKRFDWSKLDADRLEAVVAVTRQA